MPVKGTGTHTYSRETAALAWSILKDLTAARARHLLKESHNGAARALISSPTLSERLVWGSNFPPEPCAARSLWVALAVHVPTAGPSPCCAPSGDGRSWLGDCKALSPSSTRSTGTHKKALKPFPFTDPVLCPGLPETYSGLPGSAHFSSGLCLSH